MMIKPRYSWVVRLVILLCVMGVSTVTLARNKGSEKKPQPTLTLNCQQKHIEFHDKRIILNPKRSTQQLFLIHNASHQPVILNHIPKEPSASAGWASELAPDRWSAIAMNQQEFALTCQANNDSYQAIDCTNMIAVCDMPHAVFPRLNLGSYWVIENQKFPDVLAAIKTRGIRVNFPKPKTLKAETKKQAKARL